MGDQQLSHHRNGAHGRVQDVGRRDAAPKVDGVVVHVDDPLGGDAHGGTGGARPADAEPRPADAHRGQHLGEFDAGAIQRVGHAVEGGHGEDSGQRRRLHQAHLGDLHAEVGAAFHQPAVDHRLAAAERASPEQHIGGLAHIRDLARDGHAGGVRMEVQDDEAGAVVPGDPDLERASLGGAEVAYDLDVAHHRLVADPHLHQLGVQRERLA